jgi:lipopolysaccharide exporter
MSKFQNDSFNKNVLRLVTGTVLAQGISLLASPFLARIYGAEAYGVAMIFTALYSMITPLANLRYEISIVLPEKREDAANLLALSMISTIVITGFISILILVSANPILEILNITSLTPFIWLVPVMIFISGISTALNYWCSRSRYFSQISGAQVVSQMVVTTGSLVFGSLGYTTGATLILCTIVGQLATMIIFLFYVLNKDKGVFWTSVELKQVWAGCVRYKRFPLYSSFGSIFNAVSWQAPALMLGAFFSPIIAGFYGLGFRIIQMPMTLVGNSINQVFLKHGSEARNEGKLDIEVKKLFTQLFSIGLLPNLIIIIIGADLFAFVFGEQWREAGLYVQILAPWALLWLVSSPLSPIYAIQEKQKAELIMHGVIFVCRILAIFLGALYGNARVAIALFSLGGIISYTYLLVQIFKFSGLSILNVIIGIRKVILISLLYLIPVIVVYLFNRNKILIFSIGLLSLLMFYITHFFNHKLKNKLCMTL